MKTVGSTFDVFVIGGGINGAGIARDAAGRGYKVGLAEMNDFASATSSSSTKLFHGGLRYLEYFEFRLVKEALVEREVLLEAMPHISWPMRFVLPLHRQMRFESTTPASRLLTSLLPWMRGRRPNWLIRLGLFIYDHLGGRKILPSTNSINLRKSPEGVPLQERFLQAYEYSDCWVEDARLTLLNVRDAENRGAEVFARTRVSGVRQRSGRWEVDLIENGQSKYTVTAKMIVNAAGPWVADVAQNCAKLNSTEKVRLVRGSHIVTRRLFEHDKAYFLQGSDGRIMFAIPYEEDFTLIGTTDREHTDPKLEPVCAFDEIEYMIGFVNQYLAKPITTDDLVWTYSGVRPLYDDGASSASAATRDYVLKLDRSAGAPFLNVFGGKITTFRKLAESALEQIDNSLSQVTVPWTAGVPLPGGDFQVSEVEALRCKLQQQLPFLDAFTIRRLIRQFGTQAASIFSNLDTVEALGESFGHGVYAHEIQWCIDNEWVRSAEDYLWRRTKMGLRLDTEQMRKLDEFIVSRLDATERIVSAAE